ncbi:MAG: DUF4398 domain-containing protein [Pseudomarimonas sp.]
MRFVAALIVGTLLSSCASTPPPLAELDAADAALRHARDLGAESHAPVELGFAIDKRAEADAAVAERSFARAQVLANQAAADAALAAAKSRAASARAEVERKSSENAKLRRELLGQGDAQ